MATTEAVTDVEFDVPPDAEPVRCPYCDRPFPSDRHRTFHVGVRHPDECTEAERAAYDEECDDEEFELFTFHVKVVVIVLLTYFTFTYFYAMSLGG